MTIDHLVSEIQKVADSYEPNEDVKAALAEKKVLGVFGPFGVGKSTLMLKLQEIDADCSYVLGFTTRPKRHDEIEGTYKFVDHDEESLQKLLTQAQNGEFVQLTVHPSTGYVYGSDIDSYSSLLNVLDILTTSVHVFEQLPYKSFQKVYLTAPLDDWIGRIGEREDELSSDEVAKRWAEAKLSLDWAAEHESELSWVSNANGDTREAAEKMSQIGHGEHVVDEHSPAEFAQMLKITNEKTSET